MTSSDNYEDNQEAMMFSEEDIAEAVVTLERQALLPFSPAEIMPLRGGQRGYAVDVNASAMHSAIIAICVPGRSPSRKKEESAAARRAARLRVPHCILTITPHEVRARNEVLGIAAEVSVPLTRSFGDVPHDGLAFEAPYHFVGGLFGQGGRAEKDGLFTLLYNPSEHLFQVRRPDSESYLTATVRPLPSPPDPLTLSAPVEHQAEVSGGAYARALRKLKVAAICAGRADNTATYELCPGRAAVRSKFSISEVADPTLTGLSVRFRHPQRSTLETLLRRLGDTASCCVGDEKAQLSNAVMTVLFGAARAGNATAKQLDELLNEGIAVQAKTRDLMDGLLRTSIITDMAEDRDGNVSIVVNEREGLSLRAKHPLNPIDKIGTKVESGNPENSGGAQVRVSNSSLLGVISSIKEESIKVHFAERCLLIEDEEQHLRTRHALRLFI